MSQVIIYSKDHCPYCDHAKQLLDQKGVAYEEIRIDKDPEQAKIMMDLTQRKSVPQIVINGKPIGGFDDLWALEQDNRLDAMLTEDK
jgi:glutaredoxin 3